MSMYEVGAGGVSGIYRPLFIFGAHGQNYVGTWAIVGNANCFMNSSFQNVPNAINDGFEVVFESDSQPHNLRMYYTSDPDAGIVDISLNGVAVGAEDMYAAVATNRNVYDAVINPRPGKNILRFDMNSKNAASGGYRIRQEMVVIWKG